MDCPTQNAYWLDKDDRIVKVADEWNAFAEANAGKCVAAMVEGQSLWDHIKGAPTRMWMEALLALARLRGEVTKAYRCDSDNRKRFMQMTIRVVPDDQLEVQHELLREEVLNPPLRMRHASPGQRIFTRRCSSCNRLDTENGWCEPDQAVNEDLIPRERPLMVIYTVCSDCTLMLPKSAVN